VKFSEGQVASLSCGNVVLPNDTRVCVVGLENDVSLNGKWGSILCTIHEEDAANAKYCVEVGAQKHIKVKFGNVRTSSLGFDFVKLPDTVCVESGSHCS
jgi:hypothetical protein